MTFYLNVEFEDLSEEGKRCVDQKNPEKNRSTEDWYNEIVADRSEEHDYAIDVADEFFDTYLDVTISILKTIGEENFEKVANDIVSKFVEDYEECTYEPYDDLKYEDTVLAFVKDIMKYCFFSGFETENYFTATVFVHRTEFSEDLINTIEEYAETTNFIKINNRYKSYYSQLFAI